MSSHGSAPVIINASTRSLRIRGHAISLDYPTRTEQKNEANLVVIRPDRRLRGDFVDAGADHGNGRIAAEVKKALPSLEALI